MSSSSKKKYNRTKTSLVSCPICDGFLLNKDLNKHNQMCSSDCPLSIEDLSDQNISSTLCHSFILDGHLFGFTYYQTLSKDQNSAVNGWLRNHLILLHPSTMEKLGLAHGSPCMLVLPSAQTPTLFVVWPSVETPLLNIGFPRKGEAEKMMGVLKIVDNNRFCTKITFKSNEWKAFFAMPEFNFFLKEYFEGAYITENGVLDITYFGQRFQLIACDAQMENLTLERQLNQLSIGENKVDEFDCSSHLEPNSCSTPLRNHCLDLNLSTSSSIRDESSFQFPCIPSVAIFKCFRMNRETEYVITRNDHGTSVAETCITFNDVGGLNDVKNELYTHIISPISLGKAGIRTLLLYGPSGCGKTLLVSSLQSEVQANFQCYSASALFSRYYADSHKSIEGIFREASDNIPSLLVIEDIDMLCGTLANKDNSQSEAAVKMFGLLCQFIDLLPDDVWFVATTRTPERIDSALRRRFLLEIELPVPSNVDRKEILNILLKQLDNKRLELDNCLIGEIANEAHGYTGSDLKAVCTLTNSILSQCEDANISQVMQRALSKVRPSAMREITLEVPQVRWTEVGGNDQLKLQLRQAIEWPLKHPEAFHRLGISPPKGVLLYGPPGCSKTLIARALATESKLNFLAVKGPELFSKWVGESERGVRQLFHRARQAAPAIVFFDEIDALAVSRSTSASTSGVGDRVLAQLLTELDGLESLAGVTIVAATNRPDVIDGALIRPGRLDRILYVPLPEKQTRKAIFELQFAKIPVDDVDREYLVEKTDGYSGAEVVAVCKEAAMIAMRENINVTSVNKEHFEMALTAIKPRTDHQLISMYEKFEHSVDK